MNFKPDCISYMDGECDLMPLIRLKYVNAEPCPENCPYYTSEVD